MLLSILFNSQGQPVASGMACDQIPMGENYWVDVVGLAPTAVHGLDTAVVNVEDQTLATQLLNQHVEGTVVDPDRLEVLRVGLERRTLAPRRLAA